MENSAFSQEQFDSIYPEGIENHYWNHARNRILWAFLKKHRLLNERILEIGCGKGIVVDFLKKREIDCYGVELSPVKAIAAVAEYLQTNTDAFALPQDFTGKIRVILLLDVIEHIENPGLFMESILKTYTKVTHIVMTMPARPELWTNFDEFNGHFRRYGLNDIMDIANRNLKIEKAGYFNHILYPVFLLFARIIKNRDTRIKAPSRKFIFLHRLLSGILQLDARLVPGKIRGTSIIALFQVRRN